VILVVGALTYYIGGKLLAALVKRLVKTGRHREWHHKDIEKRQKTLGLVVSNIWHIFIVVVVCVSLFRETVTDADALLTPLFASAGVIGVALGFGAQSVVKDFLAGLFIIGENQYRVGDIVALGDASGTVERIGNRTTVIRDIDGNVHYIPNGSISHVVNKTMGYSMARFVVTISPTSDIKHVSLIIDEVGKKLASESKWKSKILEPPAFVSVGDFTAASLEIIIAGKTQPSDQWAVVAEMRRRLLQEFEKSDIDLAP
jgi:small conductance mechanosensitive channel